MRLFTGASGGQVAGRPTSRVLVAVDFGAPSLAAARWVARHVAPDAELVLAHVLPVPDAPAFLRDHLRPPDSFVECVSGPMRGGLDGLAATLGVGRVQVELRAGEPADQLAALAEAYDVDLVCVGRPRRRGDTVKLGRNTVDRLLRQLSVPLLQASGFVGGAPASVLAALDGGPGSDRVAGAAWALAAAVEARLTALHVLEDDVRAYVRAMEVASGAAANAALAEDALKTVAARWLATALDTGGARPGRGSPMVSRGDPGHEVLAACQRAEIDLLVLGRSGRHAKAPDTVGSTTRLVLRAAPCPVLVVPDGGCRHPPARQESRAEPHALSTTAPHASRVRAPSSSHPQP